MLQEKEEVLSLRILHFHVFRNSYVSNKSTYQTLIQPIQYERIFIIAYLH